MKSVENHIPIIKIVEDLVLLRNGDYAIGFKLSLAEVFTIGEEQLADLHQMWCAIVKAMPDNCILHKQDWFENKTYCPNFKEQNIIDRSIEFHFSEKQYIEHTAYLFIIQSAKKMQDRKRVDSSLLNSTIVSRTITDDKKYKEYLGFIAGIESQINSSKYLKCEKLNRKDYIETDGTGLLNKYCNLGNDNVLRDIDFRKPDYISIGAKKAVFYSLGSLQQFPNETYISSEKNNADYPFSFMYGIGLGLKVPHIYNQVIFKENQEDKYRKLNSKRVGMESFKKASPENEQNAAGIHDYISTASAEGKNMVRFHGNILTWGDNEADLKVNTMETSASLTKLGFVAKEEKYNNPYLYWSSFPGAASQIPFDLTCNVYHDVATSFIVNETNYRSSASDYGIKLVDRINKIPLLVDITKEPFEKELIYNINKFLVGGSGSGKSVFTNEKIRTDIKKGNHVIIGDIGGSYKRQALLLGNKAVYLEHTDKKPLSFNPFYIKSINELHNEKIFFINKTIFTCAGLTLEDNNTAANVVKKMLIEYYKYCFDNNVFQCMNTFYKYMTMYYEMLKETGRKEVDYVDFEALKINLEQFTTGHQFEHLLNANTNIDYMDKQLIVFDLETVKDDKVLFTLVTLMIMSTMIDKLFRMAYVLGKEESDKILKSLTLDEAWKALMNETMADFIKYAAKTFRKHNGELFLITQEPDDLLSNPKMAAALLGNIATKIFADVSSMGAKADDVLDIFQLPTYEKQIIKTLNRNKKESIREFFIKTGMLGRVYGLILTKEQEALYSTTPKVSGAVNRLVEKFNGNVDLAIQEYTTQSLVNS